MSVRSRNKALARCAGPIRGEAPELDANGPRFGDEPGTSGRSSRRSAPAHAVAEAVRTNAGSAAFANSSENLAKALAIDTAVTVDRAPLVDKLFAEAAAEKLVTARPPDLTTYPPGASSPMTLSTLLGPRVANARPRSTQHPSIGCARLRRDG